VEASVAGSVDLRVDSAGGVARDAAAGRKFALSLRLLGPMAIEREGRPLKLPPSRKIKGLIA